ELLEQDVDVALDVLGAEPDRADVADVDAGATDRAGQAAQHARPVLVADAQGSQQRIAHAAPERNEGATGWHKQETALSDPPVAEVRLGRGFAARDRGLGRGGAPRCVLVDRRIRGPGAPARPRRVDRSERALRGAALPVRLALPARAGEREPRRDV